MHLRSCLSGVGARAKRHALGSRKLASERRLCDRRLKNLLGAEASWRRLLLARSLCTIRCALVCLVLKRQIAVAREIDEQTEDDV